MAVGQHAHLDKNVPGLAGPVDDAALILARRPAVGLTTLVMIAGHPLDVFRRDEGRPLDAPFDLVLAKAGEFFKFLVGHGNGHVRFDDDRGGAGLVENNPVPGLALAQALLGLFLFVDVDDHADDGFKSAVRVQDQ